MSAEETLADYERAAENGKQATVQLKGRNLKAHKRKSPALLLTLGLALAMALLFSSDGMLPIALSERIVEETDVQRTDGLESMLIVFQQALKSGTVPKNTIARLRKKEVQVGTIENGEFVENAEGTALKFKNEIITADELITKVHTDTSTYGVLKDIIDESTLSGISYYYDEPAMEVFQKIGTSRNNYTKDEDFNTVMSRLMGDGSDVKANSVVLVEKKDQDGNKYYEYETLGSAAESENGNFIATVAEKSLAGDGQTADLNAAVTLNTAAKISKEQRSMLYYLGIMEPISKMKAGEGNTSRIHEAMNYIYEERETSVTDSETSEVITLDGNMLKSPSFYAVLSGERLNAKEVKNFSSDAVLKTIENRLGATSKKSTITGAITSSKRGIKGSIGRYVSNNAASASSDTLSVAASTINTSLVNNSFDSIGGIAGGEMFVEGAVNVGKALARASGATTGDAEAIRTYMRLNNTILEMDAKVDRMNRSPFDITSRNTFLGSILYKFALGMQSGGSIVRRMGSFSSVLTSSIAAILPITRADDEADSILTTFGDCETLRLSLGTEGTATCASIVTFDTSTLDDPFNDPGFIKFVEQNTELKDGVRTVKPGSKLAIFIAFNDERMTPDGITDGSILMALSDGSSSAAFTSDITAMTETWLTSSEENKRIASGEAFVNSSSNLDWEEYKYAQRYVSLARAMAALRQFDGDETSYNNIKYFEGSENPVLAFLREYRDLANK